MLFYMGARGSRRDSRYQHTLFSFNDSHISSFYLYGLIHTAIVHALMSQSPQIDVKSGLISSAAPQWQRILSHIVTAGWFGNNWKEARQRES